MNFFMSRLAGWTVLYRRGSFILVTFGAMVTAGAAIWMLISGGCLLGGGLSRRQTGVFFVGAALSALALSHGFWWLGHMRSMIRQPLLGLRSIGFVSWGALAGIAAYSAGFTAALGIPFLAVSDCVLRGLFAAYAVGRLGCLTYGCCYGIHARTRGVWYRSPDAKVIRERGECPSPRHPTQIYSATLGMALFLVLNVLPYFNVPAGTITATAFLLYPLGRASIEVFRDRPRYFGSLFTSGHLACLAMFVCGWMLLVALGPADHGLVPEPLSIGQMTRSLSLAPSMLLVCVIVFVTTGFHWKQVGTW